MATMRHSQTIECIWDIPSFTVKDNIPDWKVQTSEWNVEETLEQWKTEDTPISSSMRLRKRNMINVNYEHRKIILVEFCISTV